MNNLGLLEITGWEPCMESRLV